MTRSVTRGGGEGHEPSPFDLAEDDAVHDGLGCVAEDLLTEPLLHDGQGDPTGTEAGKTELPGHLAGLGLDLRGHDLGVDLEHEGLTHRCFLDVLDLH